MDLPIQIGVGGTFAILLIREARQILKERNGQKNGASASGNLSPETWKQIMAQIFRQETESTLRPHREALITEIHEVRKGIEECVRLLTILLDRSDRKSRFEHGRQADSS